MSFRGRLMLWTVGLWLALSLSLGLLVGFYASQMGWFDPGSPRGMKLVLAWFGSLLMPGLLAVLGTAWFVAHAASRPIEQHMRALRELRPVSVADGSSLAKSYAAADDAGLDFGLPELRAELDEARARMAEALQAQERFIANVSHEFRTPIAVLLTEADVLLKQGPTAEAARNYAASVREEMLRLKDMIDGFLLLIQIEHGKRNPFRDKVYVYDEVLDVVAGLSAFAQSYGVRIDAAIDDDSDLDGLVVPGDATLLRQMISNLVRNAVRFSPQDSSVRVTLGSESEDLPTDPDAGEVVVRVRDFGPGVPEQLVEHLFDRFVQTPAEHQRGRGTGLGLEISQSVAELFAGQIAVENLGDGGCVFTVRLPKFVNDNAEYAESRRTNSASVVTE